MAHLLGQLGVAHTHGLDALRTRPPRLHAQGEGYGFHSQGERCAGWVSLITCQPTATRAPPWDAAASAGRYASRPAAAARAAHRSVECPAAGVRRVSVGVITAQPGGGGARRQRSPCQTVGTTVNDGDKRCTAPGCSHTTDVTRLGSVRFLPNEVPIGAFCVGRNHRTNCTAELATDVVVGAEVGLQVAPR